MREIAKYRILSTPGLVVDGQVRSVGRVLSPDDVKQLLRG